MAKEIVYRKLTELTKLPNNPRTIKKDDMERLKQSIKDNPDYFEARPIILSNRTGELVILAGNQRYEAAKSLKMDEVPTFLLEGLTEAREREIIIRDNVSNGDWDMDALANEWDTQELTDWGVDINWDEPEQEVIEDEAPEVNESEPADSVLGGVYQLGEHRLMCGDSTDAGSVAILMDGQKADMVFTDPPYGLDYSGGRRQLTSTQKRGPIKNDDLTGEQLGGLLRNVFKFAKDSGDVYICASPKIQKPFLDFIYKEGKKPEATIVWDKQVMGLGFVKYRRQCEFIIFIQGKPFKMGDRQDNDLWSIKRDPSAEYVHSTQKPIKVPTRAIENSSNTGESVLDLFGGSGSTLIACEQLGRKCYMMELDPKYCDVIRKRYWKFVTGREEGWQDGTKAV